MVPAAVWADLDDVHGELADLSGQCWQRPRAMGLAGGRAERVAVGVANLPWAALGAHWTVLTGGRAEELGRPNEVGLGVADVDPSYSAGPQAE